MDVGTWINPLAVECVELTKDAGAVTLHSGRVIVVAADAAKALQELMAKYAELQIKFYEGAVTRCLNP